MPGRVHVIALACAAMLAAGCGKKVATPSTMAEPNPVPVAANAPPLPREVAVAPEDERPLSEEELFARKTLDELNAERPLADVFFDLDQSTLRADALQSLQKNADWFRRWTSTRATIEGHGDSRGTNEYNLALGERRANAARSYLISLGIAPERLMAVSKGEESPFCHEESEDCWQENRRGHFFLHGK